MTLLEAVSVILAQDEVIQAQCDTIRRITDALAQYMSQEEIEGLIDREE